jgi:hypothetical protein
VVPLFPLAAVPNLGYNREASAAVSIQLVSPLQKAFFATDLHRWRKDKTQIVMGLLWIQKNICEYQVLICGYLWQVFVFAADSLVTTE